MLSFHNSNILNQVYLLLGFKIHHIGRSLQTHSSLLPHSGQLQSQSSSGVLHVGHYVYSAKSSLNAFYPIYYRE